MTEWRHFLLIASLFLLVGVGLHHIVGEVVDPFVALAIVFLGQAIWRSYRVRRATIRRALIELGAYDADERSRMVAAIESKELRDQVGAALIKEGTERREGTSEIFPLPRAFRRRVTWRYWRSATASGGALLIAATIPSLDPLWRSFWILVGVVFLLRLRRLNRLYPALDAVIEVNPYRISYVRPDGERLTISFAQGAVCEDLPDDGMFVVRSGETTIPVSYHMMGFNRIAELVEKYGAVVPTQVPPAS